MCLKGDLTIADRNGNRVAIRLDVFAVFEILQQMPEGKTITQSKELL